MHFYAKSVIIINRVTNVEIQKIKELDKKYFMNVFGERTNICFESGEGAYLIDTEGKKYLDLFAGIAVNAVGYGNKYFTDTMCDFMQNHVLHTSNLYYVEPQSLLAEKICSCSCADKVYFANSGAEANECAIKLAKIYQYKKGSGKTKIITLKNSFHGRTLATVAATGQEKYQKPYKPLTPGFVHIDINDTEALKKEFASGDVCAVIAEPIQGESGIHPLSFEFASEMRRLCSENDAILIFDEVQTGMGRTGNLFAYETIGVTPDVFTVAKALGGGIPISACCAKDFVAKAFEPGDHGGTFGGNAFACKAGLTVFEIIEKQGLVENSRAVGAYLKDELIKLKERYPIITDVRGYGLMIGIETPMFKEFIARLLESGIVAGSAGGSVIRLVPPLIINKEDADLFIKKFTEILEESKK